jgi:hypothetical protein
MRKWALVRFTTDYVRGTVGGQIKLGHLKFNLCKSDHSIVNIFVSIYRICHTKVNLFVTKPYLNDANL